MTQYARSAIRCSVAVCSSGDSTARARQSSAKNF
jgi:hypothetical protein